MKREKSFAVITCPVCGKEYLPCEIYLPNSFLGKVNNIERDSQTKKIVTFFGQTMDLTEEFNCYDCGAQFSVVADVKFHTKEIKEKSRAEYKTSLSEGLFLPEE